MSKKYGLGKGLGSLIPMNSTIDDIDDTRNINDESEPLKGKSIIPINKIKNNNEQPRKYFDNDKIVELAESIKVHGIIQPLILSELEDGNYSIIAGERRWRAAKILGLEEVPAIVMNLTTSEILEVSLIENIQREDLNPIEEGKAYKKLIKEFNITQEQLSSRLGKSRTAITNTMRLLKLDDRVQSYIIEGILSEGHGRVLLSLDDNNLQYEIAQKIIDENFSVRDTEKLIKTLKDAKDKKEEKASQKELNPYYKDLKDRLQNYFGTKVNISNNKKKNKGKIEIEYYSEEDLQRILDIINL